MLRWVRALRRSSSPAVRRAGDPAGTLASGSGFGVFSQQVVIEAPHQWGNAAGWSVESPARLCDLQFALLREARSDAFSWFLGDGWTAGWRAAELFGGFWSESLGLERRWWRDRRAGLDRNHRTRRDRWNERNRRRRWKP